MIFVVDIYAFANCVQLSEKTRTTCSTKPQLKTSYTIAVHYWSDVTLPNGKGFGESSKKLSKWIPQFNHILPA